MLPVTVEEHRDDKFSLSDSKCWDDRDWLGRQDYIMGEG